MELEKLKRLLGVSEFFVEFQPIFCIGSKKIVGVEALLRARDETLNPIPPDKLFSLAERKGIKIELDRAARRLAFNDFKSFFLKNTDYLLFFNFDASMLDLCENKAWYIFTICKEVNLPPERVVIEIIETRVKRYDVLKTFVNKYKELGFSIALDDVGIEYSNLNRIPELRPDFIKVDRELIKNVEKDDYKQKVLKSLSYLAKEIGCFTIAEGVETESEILSTLEIGFNFHQGFKLAKPESPELVSIDRYFPRLTELNLKFVSYFKKSAAQKKRVFEKYRGIVRKIAKGLKTLKNCEKLEEKLRKLIKSYPEVQDAYVVDLTGCLVTNMIFNSTHTHTHTHTHTQKRGNL